MAKKTNIVNATLTLTAAGLKRLTTTPALSNKFHSNALNQLQVGDNSIAVSHTIHGNLLRLFGNNCDAHIQYNANLNS